MGRRGWASIPMLLRWRRTAWTAGRSGRAFWAAGSSGAHPWRPRARDLGDDASWVCSFGLVDPQAARASAPGKRVRVTLLLVPVLLVGGAVLAAPRAPAVHADSRPREVHAPAQASAPAPLPAGRIRLTREQAREAFATGHFARPISTLLDIQTPLRFGEYRWDDAGVPDNRTWISIDLEEQLISVFRGPHEIGTAVILFGATSRETPVGTFPILAKLKHHRSITYDNAPMPYTLRLTPDGVSIHGSNVRDGYATHGCIGVPVDFAAKLFDAVSRGDKVVISDPETDRGA